MTEKRNLNNKEWADFCRRHFEIRALKKSQFQINYKKEELLKLCSAAISVFESESALSEIAPPLTIVGDIHGQFKDLLRILSAQNDKKVRKRPAFATKKFVFLGDYVDRGNRSLECIALVFVLKVLFPSLYVLLRGNHETKSVNCSFGFKDELTTRLGSKDGLEVWEKFNEAFSWMPLACLIGKQILCMHGGISSSLTCFEDIRKIRRPMVDVTTDYLALDLVWADPLDYKSIESTDNYILFLANSNRGLSCYFNESAVKDCCQQLDIQLIVRAHQMVEDGFKFYADRKMITVFSAPKYMQEYENKGAVLRVSENGGVSVVQIGRRLGPQTTPMESTPKRSEPSETPLKRTPSASIRPSSQSSDKSEKKEKKTS